MAKDLVCGMDVDEQQAGSRGLTSDYQGQTYYFCAPGCKQQFDGDPQRFIGQQSQSGQSSM